MPGSLAAYADALSRRGVAGSESRLVAHNLKDVVGQTLWLEQLKAMGLTLAISCIGTAVIAYAIKATMGLRPSQDDEESGLDITGHGERGYHMTEA